MDAAVILAQTETAGLSGPSVSGKGNLHFSEADHDTLARALARLRHFFFK